MTAFTIIVTILKAKFSTITIDYSLRFSLVKHVYKSTFHALSQLKSQKIGTKNALNR